jgi:hypothetical protein
MSKADHALITPAVDAPTRRRFLSTAARVAGAATGAAVLPAAAAKAAPAIQITADHVALIQQIRTLNSEVDRLVSIEMACETPKGQPGYRKYRRACHSARRAEAKLDRLAKRILQQPAKNWGDVAVRGELAAAYAERTRAGGFAFIDRNPVAELGKRWSCDAEDLTLGSLMTAVLAMGVPHGS